MREYIDLVLCETCNGKRELLQAPAWTHLKAGDMVVASCGDGEVMMNVVSSICIGTDTEEFEFILEMANSVELEKIKSKIIIRELNYEEDKT